MAYRLQVTGDYALNDRVFETLGGAAAALINAMRSTPQHFTVQCYDRDGKFERAFGGTASSGEIKYDGWTSCNEQVKSDMKLFRKDILGIA